METTIAGERLQILTYARHSWPLSSEGSFTCHTYCDTGLPFIMIISEDPWHSHLLPSVCGVVTTWFYDSGLSRPGIEPRFPSCEANALPLDIPVRHGSGLRTSNQAFLRCSSNVTPVSNTSIWCVNPPYFSHIKHIVAPSWYDSHVCPLRAR